MVHIFPSSKTKHCYSLLSETKVTPTVPEVSPISPVKAIFNNLLLHATQSGRRIWYSRRGVSASGWPGFEVGEGGEQRPCSDTLNGTVLTQQSTDHSFPKPGGAGQGLKGSKPGGVGRGGAGLVGGTRGLQAGAGRELGPRPRFAICLG